MVIVCSAQRAHLLVLHEKHGFHHQALRRRNYKQSRGAHFREDFPSKDAEWGRWNVSVKRGADGAMRLARTAIPELPSELARILRENE